MSQGVLEGVLVSALLYVHLELENMCALGYQWKLDWWHSRGILGVFG
jgi:hypothetical protein